MSQPAKAQEPSMEEILASIRRIIADDEAAKPAKPQEPAPTSAPAPVAAVEKPTPRPVPRPVAPPPAAVEAKTPTPPPVQPAADVLDLTEAMAATPSAPPSFRTIDGQSDVVFADRPHDAAPPPPPEPAVRAVEEARKQFASMPDRALLSATTANAVDNAFNSLAHTVLGNNARTLEDLVKEMLRPMLKSWLDDNLPGLVDRIVRAEIERVSRGR
jgi:cell pole-organizing protein PopZ